MRARSRLTPKPLGGVPPNAEIDARLPVSGCHPVVCAIEWGKCHNVRADGAFFPRWRLLPRLAIETSAGGHSPAQVDRVPGGGQSEARRATAVLRNNAGRPCPWVAVWCKPNATR